MLTIGIMTGNSLDGVDAVLSEFSDDEIRDVGGVSLPYSFELKQNMLELRRQIIELHSDMAIASQLELYQTSLRQYTELLAKAVSQLLEKCGVDKADVAAIGLHGQSTGEHNPPSVAGDDEPFTTQIFDAAELALKTGIPVVYDFRSDDIFQGGEGAPLAPIHNLHLSNKLAQRGIFPVCFINGGNTANIAVVSTMTKTADKDVFGYDCGAFNHYVDALAKEFFDLEYDKDGQNGLRGHVNASLLADLYAESAIIDNGDNFYDLLPPKSSGPHLYNMLRRLKEYPLAEEDILRTVEYFSAYVVFLSLRFIPSNVEFPKYFILFGGGWKNPLIYRDFIGLMHGHGVILPQHYQWSQKIYQRICKEKFYIAPADEFGISGQYMEARIFADLAYCYLTGRRFTRPSVTGGRQSVVCGVMCRPGDNLQLRGRGYTFSRAAKGWSKLL